MERRAFLRLLGIGLAAGPEAIAEAMKPRIFYSIPAVPVLEDMAWASVGAGTGWTRLALAYDAAQDERLPSHWRSFLLPAEVMDQPAVEVVVQRGGVWLAEGA